MSDFIYCSNHQPKGRLFNLLGTIHNGQIPECREYHGEWGSLAVFENHYRGFDVFEDDRYIAGVIGGPIVKFNFKHESCDGSHYKTKAIFDKWIVSGNIEWDEDLSGPFTAFCIDKINCSFKVVTDLLSFIPVYIARPADRTVVFGTHVDVVAEAACENTCLDDISIADYIVNRSVIFPFTFYRNVKQLCPATEYRYYREERRIIKGDYYWLPIETNKHPDFKRSAEDLRAYFTAHISEICNDCSEVGLLVSGGEDSRTVLAAIPGSLKKIGHIFVDSFNREAQIASKVCNIFDCELKIGYRDMSHYLKHMAFSARLIGSQYEFHHVHTYGFHKDFMLDKYEAVIGGLLSDAFCKGSRVSVTKYKIFGYDVWPSRIYKGELKADVKENDYDLINPSIRRKIVKRHKNHGKRVKTFRPTTTHEWFYLWPITMVQPHANFLGNRRIFRSYEPFTDTNIIKLMAQIPQEWKINRKIFNAAFKPLLKPSRYVSHTDGHFPYFSYIVNLPVSNIVKTIRRINDLYMKKKIAGQGPWPIWDEVLKTDLMSEKVNQNKECFNLIQDLFHGKSLDDVLNGGCHPFKKLALVQVLMYLNKQHYSEL
jgi:hypothetical protein